jgi:hypothetical protein
VVFGFCPIETGGSFPWAMELIGKGKFSHGKLQGIAKINAAFWRNFWEKIMTECKPIIPKFSAKFKLCRRQSE